MNNKQNEFAMSKNEKKYAKGYWMAVGISAGLGLAIVKALVGALGVGTIHAESDGKDQGSKFTIRFPFESCKGE